VFKIISLELAKKLKDAGLTWEPQYGDFYYMRFGDGTLNTGEVEVFKKGFDCTPFPEEDIFAPRLDQLLAEIEKYGINWELFKTWEGSYCCELYVGSKNYNELVYTEAYENMEKTAGQALLWILERGKV
jgi:hypothetical protein